MNLMKSNLKKENKARLTAVAFCLFLIAAILLQVLPSTTKAQTDSGSPEVAPTNDNFANAQVISGLSGTVTGGTNVGATKETGEPAHAMNRGGSSVWYKYVAVGNGALSISTFQSEFDTLLAVYQGNSVSNLKLVAANDDIAENNTFSSRSTLKIGTKTGDTYYIAIDGKNNINTNVTATGGVGFSYSLSNSVPNDNFANALSIFFDNSSMKVTTNVGASKEAGEPSHAGNAGGKSVWYFWRSNTDVPKSYTFTLESTQTQNSGSYVKALFSIYTGTSVNALTEIASKQVTSKNTKLQFISTPNTVYYFAVDGLDEGAGADTGTFTLSYRVTKSPKEPDFDQDGRADVTVFRPITGTWYSLDSITDKMRPFQWGANGDKPVIADFDHDYVPDYTIFRPDTGTWYINKGGAWEAFNWGLAGDIPMIYNAYFQNQHYSYPIVFRPTDGTWYMYIGASGRGIQWGSFGDIPMTADFNGDGNDELAVFRPSNGTWYILNLTTNQFQETKFGQSGDKPVPADYDGDGDADIAIYRPQTDTWWFLNQVTGAQTAIRFGQNLDKPVPADYDGDGKADIAVYRTGTWWILQSSNNNVRVVSFGLSTDIPLTAPAS